MKSLTPQQARCLAAIKAQIEKTGRPPSFRDLMVDLNLRSLSGVSRIVGMLEERGHIRRLPVRKYAIELVDPADQTDVLSFLDNVTLDRLRKQSRSSGVRAETIIAGICKAHFSAPRSA